MLGVIFKIAMTLLLLELETLVSSERGEFVKDPSIPACFTSDKAEF